MAEDDNTAQDKTERATSKRVDEARKRGQVIRSPELNAAAVMLAGGSALWLAGSGVANGLAAVMRGSFTIGPVQQLEPAFVIGQFGSSMISSAIACAPVLGLTFVAAIVAPMMLSGWNFSGDALGFKFDRLSLLQGLGRMASVRGFVELTKALAKFAWVGTVAWLVLSNQRSALLHLGQEPIGSAVRHAAALCGAALLALAGAMALIAALDVPWQMWQYQRELRMSREQIREENKESEGSPEIKSRIRALQQAMARRRMMTEVTRATVVITNPTHYAVALRYDERRHRAPIVVAKGADAVAARIREIAAENLVPLVEAAPLARALYRNVDLGGEVPANLYVSVAQILTYVYQLRHAKQNGATLPTPPHIDPEIDTAAHPPGTEP